MRATEAPTAAVVAVVAAGLVTAVTVDWRPGMVVVSLALLLAASLRLALPVRQAGWLVVRSRAFDAGVLLVLGLGLIALTTTIPEAG